MVRKIGSIVLMGGSDNDPYSHHSFPHLDTAFIAALVGRNRGQVDRIRIARMGLLCWRIAVKPYSIASRYSPLASTPAQSGNKGTGNHLPCHCPGRSGGSSWHGVRLHDVLARHGTEPFTAGCALWNCYQLCPYVGSHYPSSGSGAKVLTFKRVKEPYGMAYSQTGRRPNTVWSRRPPLCFKLSCLACEGAIDSSMSCQRGRVGAAHTNRYVGASLGGVA